MLLLVPTGFLNPLLEGVTISSSSCSCLSALSGFPLLGRFLKLPVVVRLVTSSDLLFLAKDGAAVFKMRRVALGAIFGCLPPGGD